MIESILFSADLATLAAQVAPVLVVAFLVEFRAIAEHRSLDGKDVRGLLAAVFVTLAVVLLLCFLIVASEDPWTGNFALFAWVTVVGGIGLLISYVWAAGWAAIRISSRETQNAVSRSDTQDLMFSTPGLNWLLRGQREPLHVVAAVIEHKGQVLVARRREGKTSAGKWEFPGGKVQKHEELADALLREIREELNARIRITERLTSDVTVQGRTAIRLTCFKAKLIGRRPGVSTDHDRLLWLPISKLDSLEWSLPDLPAVKVLMNDGAR